MTEIHGSNKAFEKPITEFNAVASELYEVLGTLHLVMVEDQVFLNDIQIRMNQAAGASTLADELRPHKVGGMSFHRVPTDPELKILGRFTLSKAIERTISEGFFDIGTIGKRSGFYRPNRYIPISELKEKARL